MSSSNSGWCTNALQICAADPVGLHQMQVASRTALGATDVRSSSVLQRSMRIRQRGHRGRASYSRDSIMHGRIRDRDTSVAPEWPCRVPITARSRAGGRARRGSKASGGHGPPYVRGRLDSTSSYHAGYRARPNGLSPHRLCGAGRP